MILPMKVYEKTLIEKITPDFLNRSVIEVVHGEQKANKNWSNSSIRYPKGLCVKRNRPFTLKGHRSLVVHKNYG